MPFLIFSLLKVGRKGTRLCMKVPDMVKLLDQLQLVSILSDIDREQVSKLVCGNPFWHL